MSASVFGRARRLVTGLVNLRRPPAYGYFGVFSSWAEAMAQCTGYDADAVLSKVAASARLVRDGVVAYERDSVTFAEPEYVWPLLSGLLLAATRARGRLSVLDFGGSLGSRYYQHRALLGEQAGLDELRWTVVEQPAFVDLGRREFQDEVLGFRDSLADCLEKDAPNLLLLSSVLPYLERPHDQLAELVDAAIPWILVDRTPFLDAPEDRLTVQRVPPSIYEASYPAWFFVKDGFLDHFRRGYALLSEFEALDGRKTLHPDRIRSRALGFLFRRREEGGAAGGDAP